MARVPRGAWLALLLALALGAGAATAGVRHSLDPNDEKKVVICHWDEAGKWTQNEVSVNAIIQGQGGHANHPNDIIPPFDYSGGSFPGLNWPSGEATWLNGCVSPPTPQPIGVFVACNATSADGTTYSATFGYNSDNAADVNIPIGNDNSVEPASFSGNQPTTFHHGTVSSAFTVSGIPIAEGVTWSVNYAGQPSTITSKFESPCVTPPEPPQLSKVGIFVRCVTNNGATFDATFGYQNDNLDAVTIPVGDANGFAPAPENRGQTTKFQPGNVQEAFTVKGIPSSENLVWTLTSNETRTTTASSTFETKCSDPPPDAKPIGVFVTCIDKHGSTYDATFGYQNDNNVAETMEIGPANGFSPAPVDRGQPTVFVPGRTVQAVVVHGIPANTDLTWTVAYDGTRKAIATAAPPSTATANTSSPACSTTPPTPNPEPPNPTPPDPPGPKPPEPPRPLGIFAACVLNSGRTYAAVFGYVNLNVGNVVIPIGSRNNVRPGADDQGQPETFEPGFVAFAFAISGIPARRTVTWTVTFGDETRVATATATFHRKCPTAPLDPYPDLKITKRANPGIVHVGHRVVFTITVKNIGHRTMRPLVITDRRLDDRVEVLSTTSTLGACRVLASASQRVSACGQGTLAPGESAVVRILGRAVRSGRAVDRAAALFRPGLDPTPRNNVAHASAVIRERRHPPRKPRFTG